MGRDRASLGNCPEIFIGNIWKTTKGPALTYFSLSRDSYLFPMLQTPPNENSIQDVMGGGGGCFRIKHLV